MGIRLYPVLSAEEVTVEQEFYLIAQFLGYRPVDARIALQYRAIWHGRTLSLSQEEQIWDFMHRRFPRADQIYDFALFGFGKFQYPIGEQYVGTEHDPDTMTRMLWSLVHPFPFTEEQLGMVIALTWG